MRHFWLWQLSCHGLFHLGLQAGGDARMAGRITAIQVQKRDPNRANVFLDGEFAFGLALVEAVKLSTGQYLSQEAIAALQAADEEERAYELALIFLSYRPRSKVEVARRLNRKGFSEPSVEAVLHRLARSGLLDDEAFARYWISNREQFKPRGRYALRYELRAKGIASDIIDTLLDEVDDGENAYQAALQRINRWKQLEPEQRRRKLDAYLRRRGFKYETIQGVWERILAEHVEDTFDMQEEEHTTWDQET
jgi:regulatory protein